MNVDVDADGGIPRQRDGAIGLAERRFSSREGFIPSGREGGHRGSKRDNLGSGVEEDGWDGWGGCDLDPFIKGVFLYIDVKGSVVADNHMTSFFSIALNLVAVDVGYGIEP